MEVSDGAVAPVSGAGGEKKPKSQRDRFELQFTCNLCETRNAHSVSRKAYTKGTVIVTCPNCKATHLVADNLNWIEDDFRNLEDFMAKRGTPVTRVVKGGAAVEAAAAAAGELHDGGDDEAEEPIDRIDGIDEGQAMRIRQAMRARREARAQEKIDGVGGAGPA